MVLTNGSSLLGAFACLGPRYKFYSGALVVLLLDSELLPGNVVLAPFGEDVSHGDNVQGFLPADDEGLLGGGAKVRGARVEHGPVRVVRVDHPKLADAVEEEVVTLK